MASSQQGGDAHRWHFFRSAGFDQVAIESGDDLRHLGELDPKLWTALNCPTSGLEFDARTLALLDTDGDGQIRVPEILAAVRWVCGVLKDPEVMFAPPGLALDWIDDTHSDGAMLRAAAAKSLQYLGKPAEGTLEVADFEDMTTFFSAEHFNGDGVAVEALTNDEAVAAVIADIVATQGGVTDRSGEPGVTADTVEAFFSEAAAVLEWHARGASEEAGVRPLGEATEAAVAALERVQVKVDDYFTRCRLAAFDPRAVESLNPPASAYDALADHELAGTDADVAALPLAAVAADQPLPLADGLNPAWAGAVADLRELVVTPLIGARDSLGPEDWEQLRERLGGFRAWQAERPETSVYELGTDRLNELVSGDLRERLAALIELDLNAETSADSIDALERLVRCQRDLVTLLRNFVTLSDFYRGQQKAIFQAGTLYLDQRSCELVLRVADMTRHTQMAPFSGCYLVYCSCVREGSEPITIVAALTNGEVDELMVPGRHGVFYDRQGQDWKATVTSVVEQPISLRQAFWAPYRRIGRFIEDQMQKFAAARDKSVETSTAGGVTSVAAVAEGGQAAAAPPAFDIAKFAGIFAAIGLAVGAIGTALVAMISGLFALAWWQLPLVLAGVLLLISGPSMLLAWLTLRRRNLGPLLDANGWAVNARARINVPFGAALTGIATLPSGSRRSLGDPYAEKKRPWKLWLFVLVLVIAAVVLWRQGVFDELTGAAPAVPEAVEPLPEPEPEPEPET